MMDWAPSRDELDYLAEKTASLRTSDVRHWAEAREHLASMGISPDDAAVGDIVDEGVAVEYAVVATRDERIFDFLILYGFAPGTGRHEGQVSRWREVRPEDIRRTDFGFPDLRGRAAVAARMILDRDLQAR